MVASPAYNSSRIIPSMSGPTPSTNEQTVAAPALSAKRRSWLRSLAINVAVLLGTCVLLLVVCELVARLVLPPPQMVQVQDLTKVEAHAAQKEERSEEQF